MSEESVDSQSVLVDPIRNTAIEAILETFLTVASFRALLEPEGTLTTAELLGHIKGIPSRNPAPTNGVHLLFGKLLTDVRNVQDGAVTDIFTYSEKGTRECHPCETVSIYNYLMCCGHTILASKLRELDALLLKKLSFEELIKVSMFNETERCVNPLCRKHNCVERELEDKLPSVYVLALNWEINETHAATIQETMETFKTTIDLTNIYKCNGQPQPPLVAHELTAMVCRGAEGYFCVSLENDTWVKHSAVDGKLPFGQWSHVILEFAHQKIRPDLLFFHEEVVEESNGLKRKAEDNEGDVRKKCRQ